MDGSSVAATASNAGGAIGNARHVSSRMQIRAIISGSVTVKASADAGGTCGLYRSGSNSDNSEIILQQGSGSSYLYVRAHNLSTGVCDIGNENAGGLIGFVTFLVITAAGLADTSPYEGIGSFGLGIAFGMIILGVIFTSRYAARIREFKKRLMAGAAGKGSAAK